MIDLSSYKNARGLIETNDPELERPVCRKPGFDGIQTSKEMDEKISSFLKDMRESKNLSRAELAQMLGLSVSVYGRYERAESRMTVPRLIHLCELMGFMPIDMIFEAAPHLWGKTPEEAEERRTLTRLIELLPPDATRDLIRLLKRMTPGEQGAEALANTMSEGR